MAEDLDSVLSGFAGNQNDASKFSSYKMKTTFDYLTKTIDKIDSRTDKIDARTELHEVALQSLRSENTKATNKLQLQLQLVNEKLSASELRQESLSLQLAICNEKLIATEQASLKTISKLDSDIGSLYEYITQKTEADNKFRDETILPLLLKMNKPTEVKKSNSMFNFWGSENSTS